MVNEFNNAQCVMCRATAMISRWKSVWHRLCAPLKCDVDVDADTDVDEGT